MDIIHTPAGRTVSESESQGSGECWCVGCCVYMQVCYMCTYVNAMPNVHMEFDNIHVHVHVDVYNVYVLSCFFVCVDSYHTPPLLLFPLPPAIHTHLVWSLSSVKVALSHLHWQREKVLRSDTPLHLKIGSNLMEVVGAAFHLKPDKLFNRTRMVKSLLSQQKRGAVSGHTHTHLHTVHTFGPPSS